MHTEVDYVEAIWDAAVPHSGHHVSLASLEQHTPPKKTVLPQGTQMPVLLMRGVRKEFQLPQVGG